MRKLFGLFLFVFFISANAIAADELLLPNTTYSGYCDVLHTGVFDGSFAMVPVYETSGTINCPAGKYLPAGSETCAPCLANHYCSGGDLIASNQNVGISECPDGLVSPSGTDASGKCGKKMKIGDDILFLTTQRQTLPALAVRLEGRVYYARATELSSGAKLVHDGATHGLRMKIDGTEYSIHDDTVQ